MSNDQINNAKFILHPEWADTIVEPKDVEVVEAKILIPKILWDRFCCAKTFVPNANPKKAFSVSKRLSRYILRYHALVNNKEEGLLLNYLDLPEVDKALRKYDSENAESAKVVDINTI